MVPHLHRLWPLLILSWSFQLGIAYRVGDNPYHRKDKLDPLGKYELEWEVDWDAEEVTFTVTVETKGYVGFGLSSNGKMTGADIVIGGVKEDGRSYFSDRHAVGNQMPVLDPSQDWNLLSASENGSHTSLKFSRAFDTCDPQDYRITVNKIAVIWAYGERDDELTYHFQHRGIYNAYLLDAEYAPELRRIEGGTTQIVGIVPGATDIQTWTMKRLLEIPENDTSYICTMHKAPTLLTKHHFIGYTVEFGSEESRRAVHHILVYKCNPPPGIPSRSMFDRFLGLENRQSCNILQIPTGPMPTDYCTDVYQGYAVGGRPFFLPDHVGFPFGETPDEYYVFQVHYDNPNRASNLMVDVSIQMFYTPTLRPNEGGLFTLGLETPGLTPSLLIPPNSRSQRVFGHCSTDCTSRMFPPEGINIVAMILHTHNSGRRLRFHHFRQGRELPWLGTDDNYSFDFQQLRTVRKDGNVLPGDHLAMDCSYDNTLANGSSVVGGFSTRQEMCLAFVIYYNRMTDYSFCRSVIDSPEARERFLGVGNVTWAPQFLEYVATSPPSLAGLTMSEVSNNHVNWDLERRRDLQRFHLHHPHRGQCSKMLHALTGGPSDSFTGPTGYPFSAKEYQDSKESCSQQRNHYHHRNRGWSTGHS